MSLATNLRCINCGEEYPLNTFYNCQRCGNILDVEYHLRRNTLSIDKRDVYQGIWKYYEHMPVKNEQYMLSLQEGMTPLFLCKNKIFSQECSLLYFKDETRNPTGSFKDRPASVSISKALEVGCEGVITASSGNAGSAAAAYAAAAGLESIILVPEKVPLAKLMQIFIYGSHILKVKGDYSNSFRLAKEMSEEGRYVNLTSTFYNPYGLEGDKTIAFELYDQLDQRVPDWIFVPIGAGPLLVGIYKGYHELFQLGLTNTLPKMVGVQAEGCAPITKAFQEGCAKVQPWQDVATIASGISDPLKGYSQDGTYTLNIIRKSGGYALAISDKELVNMLYEIGKTQGLYVEPTSASTPVAFLKMKQKGLIKQGAISICILTGSGFKDSKPVLGIMKEIPVINPSFSELNTHIDGFRQHKEHEKNV